jgi:hypothetical protein
LLHRLSFETHKTFYWGDVEKAPAREDTVPTALYARPASEYSDPAAGSLRQPASEIAA